MFFHCVLSHLFLSHPRLSPALFIFADICMRVRICNHNCSWICETVPQNWTSPREILKMQFSWLQVFLFVYIYMLRAMICRTIHRYENGIFIAIQHDFSLTGSIVFSPPNNITKLELRSIAYSYCCLNSIWIIIVNLWSKYWFKIYSFICDVRYLVIWRMGSFSKLFKLPYF